MEYVFAIIIIGFVILFAILIGPFFGVILGAIVGIIVAAIIYFALAFIVGGIEERREEREKQLEFERKHPHIDAENFYNICNKAGVRSAKTQNGIAKIKECAKTQSLRITEQEAIDFYLLGQSEVKRIKDEEEQVRLAKLTEEEKEYEKYITRFAELSPHDKVNKMCRERADEKREELELLKAHQDDGFNSADKVYNLSKRKEYDWATMGGIASGLAGGAAGVAVAVDAQIKNAEIRQQNSQLQNAAYTLAAMSWMDNINKQTAVEKAMKWWEKKAQCAYRLKVERMPEDNLLEILSPSLVQKIQNKTGSLVLKAKIKPYYDLGLKVGNNSAVIDGTIKAIIWKGDIRVGEAILTLPLDNNGYREAVLEGICRSKSLKYKEQYTVTFEPNALWLIEELWHLD